MPAPVEVVRLSQAIEAFKSRAPKDLPDGILPGLEDIEGMLRDYAPDPEDSPGKAAARQAKGTDGTGEHYSKAAKGPDGPSPGQREARRLSEEIAEEADKLQERV